jgi:hypothetical protein
MQSICQDTRRRMRDMKEDQRQLRRRIQELEKQLLLSSCHFATSTTHLALAAATEGTHLVDSGEYDDEEDDVPNQVKPCIREESRKSNEKIHAVVRKPVKVREVDRAASFVRRPINPPAFLSIPKVQPAATCLYLTDGEGLSDSEFI